MKKFLLLISLFLVASIHAQTFNPSASEITMEQAEMLYTDLKLENEKMKKHSECFERAHMWSFRSERVHNITTEKVFIFFTKKFEMEMTVKNRWGRTMTWWFHVAPAVRVNGELIVLDATFADKPQPVQEWVDSITLNDEQCVEMVNYEDFANDRNNSSNIQCYSVATPQYVYGPLDLGLVDKGRMLALPPKPPKMWFPQTLKSSLKSYKLRHRSKAREELKI